MSNKGLNKVFLFNFYLTFFKKFKLEDLFGSQNPNQLNKVLWLKTSSI